MQATNAVAAKREKRSRAMLVCTLVALLSGCKVGAEDIEYWKGTVKGPGKLVAVMLADKYEMDLRTQAALALVEMDRTDKDGAQELQQALQRLDETTRTELISGMIPGLEAQMRQKDPKVEGSASPAQIRAKDAAFVLTNHASPEGKARLTQAVVGWYVEDFNGRSLAGHYSAEQVVRGLGSPGAKVLVGGLEAKLPQQALVKMAQLIGQIADSATRKEAANRLVALEKEMEGDAFLNWIKKTIQEQTADSGKALEPPRLLAAALMNRDNFINEGAIPAMKWLSDEPVIKRRLLALASTPANGEAGNARRMRALQALEGKVAREDLQQVLALALDTDNPTAVRDYAFDRVGDIKSPDALPSLWPLVADNDDQRLRWRAGELVLTIGGPGVIEELFAKLPANGEYPREELEGYATRLGQMNPLPSEQARKLLSSANWYARVTAIHFFVRKGNQDDVKRLTAAKSDKAPVKGPRWGKTKTVGDVAEEALENAKQKQASAQ